MHPTAQAMVERLTEGGEIPLSSVASEVVNQTVNKAEVFIDVWNRNRLASLTDLTPEDSDRLDSIEHAGDSLVWAFTFNPEDSTRYAVRVAGSGDDGVTGIAINRPSTIFGTHLSFMGEGIIAVWTPDKEAASGKNNNGDFLLVSTAEMTQDELSESLHVLPVTEEGLPRMMHSVIEVLINAAKGLRQHVRDDSARPPGAYI